MGVSGAVRWWDEWQLLVLALASLTIQYFLAFFAGARKFFIPSWYRFVIWLSFVASDVVAIYALATLFNRQKKMDRDLELFWAPILLIHLGGQLSITAYNLEDNEQWKQYIITVPSQVAVAFYSFYKSWPLSDADKRLSAAAILLFVVGIIKCVLKPWALKSASFNSLASSFKSAERTTATSRESELANYVQDAKTFFEQADANPPPSLSPQQGFSKPERLFLDYAHPYSDRLRDLRNFWVLDKEAAYKSITGELSGVFDLLYTRVREDGTLVRRMAGTSAASLIVGVALILFHKSHKVTYSRNDITATFVLLWGTFVLELSSSLLAVHIKKVTSFFFGCSVLRQASILADVATDKKFLKQCDSSRDITSLVREHVKEGWKSYITDAESYRRFNDLRGQWTLEREGCDDQDLRWSLERPFGESITLWHFATAFCYHTMATSPAHEYARQSMEISNYMMNLFLTVPEMLIAGNTTSLPVAIYHQVENIRYEITLTIWARPPDTKNVTELLINHLKEKEQELSGKFILYAFKLFSHLRDVGDEEKMWKVIKGVWVEMLCFSASRGRGFMHAKALGTGGEYLSIVWLLLARAGMETYPDRLHRTTKPQWTEEMRKNYLQKEEEIDGPIPEGSATSASPAAKVD